MKKRILICGEICREITTACALENEINRADGYTASPGGMGAELCATLNFYGNEVQLCTRVGSDNDGKALTRVLESGQFGTSARFVTTADGCRTSLKMNFDTPDGKRTVICRESGLRIGKRDVEDGFMSYPEWVVLCETVGNDGAEEAGLQSRRKEAGIIVISAESADYLKSIGRCALLVLTDAEVQGLTAESLSTTESCTRACTALSKLIKSDFVVIELKGRGYFIFDGTFFSMASGYNLPKECLSDDTRIMFLASLTDAFINSGDGIQDVCKYASTAAAMYVAMKKERIPTRKEIKGYLANHK